MTCHAVLKTWPSSLSQDKTEAVETSAYGLGFCLLSPSGHVCRAGPHSEDCSHWCRRASAALGAGIHCSNNFSIKHVKVDIHSYSWIVQATCVLLAYILTNQRQARACGALGCGKLPQHTWSAHGTAPPPAPIRQNPQCGPTRGPAPVWMHLNAVLVTSWQAIILKIILSIGS